MLALVIDGKDYIGWKEVSLTRSITSIAGTFTLKFTDAFREVGLPPIRAGKSFKIFRDNVLLKSGFIDKVVPAFDKDGISFDVSGRDKAMDIVDCSVDIGTNEWKNLFFQELVFELVKPFKGIGVKVNVSTGEKIESVNNDDGLMTYELIRQQAEKKQLLVYSDFNGDIIIDQVSKDVSTLSLVEGTNIISGEAAIDVSQVFSRYIVTGEQQSTDFFEEEDEIIARQEFKDNRIGRERPIVIIQDGATDNAAALRRAKWEATTRMALSESYKIEVQGWHPDINKLITIDSPTLKLDKSQMTIAGVELIIDGEGERTKFQLAPPRAFEAIPADLLEKDEDSSLWWL